MDALSGDSCCLCHGHVGILLKRRLCGLLLSHILECWWTRHTYHRVALTTLSCRFVAQPFNLSTLLRCISNASNQSFWASFSRILSRSTSTNCNPSCTFDVSRNLFWEHVHIPRSSLHRAVLFEQSSWWVFPNDVVIPGKTKSHGDIVVDTYIWGVVCCVCIVYVYRCAVAQHVFALGKDGTLCPYYHRVCICPFWMAIKITPSGLEVIVFFTVSDV